METFLQRVLLRAMCSPQHGSKDAHDLLSAHTRVRCASRLLLVCLCKPLLSAHTRVRCTSRSTLGRKMAPLLSTHTRVRCTSWRLQSPRDNKCSQLIPACGVHRAPLRLLDQPLQALSSYPRAVCIAAYGGTNLCRTALSSYPRAVCIYISPKARGSSQALNSYPRAVCIGKSH